MSDHTDEDDVGDLTVTGRSGCRISLEWRIPDFLSLDTEKDKKYAFYESPLFTFYDARWYLIIYPKKSCNGLSGFVSLYLYRYKSGPLTTTFHAMLGIRGADGVENRKEGLLQSNFEEDEDEIFCWDGFYIRSELRSCKFRLMPEDKLIISLDLESGEGRDTSTQTEESQVDEVATEEKKSLEKQGEKEVLNCLHKLLAGGEDSDVLIKVQGKEFPAHRAILRARSPVFQAMFSHDMVEKNSGVVSMEGCDPESFPAFLEHIYTGSNEIISIGNVFSLFPAADKYNLSTLKEACTKFIKNNLTVSCFCEAVMLAVMHNEKELIECATEFFSSNVTEILKTVEWQIFLKENTVVGNELLIKAFGKVKEELSMLNSQLSELKNN